MQADIFFVLLLTSLKSKKTILNDLEKLQDNEKKDNRNQSIV